MPLVNMKPLLREAMEQGYAVAAFNLVDYGTTKAMIKAAEELKAPVIVQVSTKTIKYYSHQESLTGSVTCPPIRRRRSSCTWITARTSTSSANAPKRAGRR